ncbi:RHS repeat-associated core domain-containing protein [Pseudomonas sp. McL0111]|uniref:RHS repeat-associated core domain-containing protein n=1 Tax=Pseudomonas sp. McL0111 TaxID=3457357 RepID=UPI00403EAC42
MNLSVHRRTPSVSVIDGRGLVICQVAYWRKVAGGPVEALTTRQRYDAAGRPVEHWDSRLFGSAPKPNLATFHGLTEQALKIDSVDSGWRLSLPGLAGEVVKRWDERGNQWSNYYDNRLRLVSIEVNSQPGIEVLTFGSAEADAGKNLRGQLVRKIDASGSMTYASFSLHALPLEETRTLFDGIAYTTHWSYGANGIPLSQKDAGEHEQYSIYDVAGQLQCVRLRINPDDTPSDIIKRTRYNAEGQPIEQVLGNDVVRYWIYDPATTRLKSLQAGVPGQILRQDLEYEYDNVGNVVSIRDNTFTPVFYANQYIDGKRDFSYDSLSRLTCATGHDALPPTGMPGRPLPSDPNIRLNYTQTYEYDTGGNLIKLVHSRAVGGYTQQMLIDPCSNRGVRWKEGDPLPDFSTQFDRHGNLQTLQPGQPLQWNTLDELTSVTLIEREKGLSDQKTYCYSAGARIYKRHETHAYSTTQYHEVRYLPGLEIRTRDTDEVLHVISLPSVIGNVRCLHWRNKRPGDIDNNQVRYCLEDSQNSSLVELDEKARLISCEQYYPFGGTSSLTAGSTLEVSYKTIRYSGKELDDSGLYYYGRRYYAPWFQRWISADPAGAVDGWNLYAMVGNNPVTFIDELGLCKDLLNQRVSERTTSMITEDNNIPTGSPAKTERYLNLHPDSRFTKTFRNKKAVAHAGAEISHTSFEQNIILTDFFNIARETGTLTTEQHGIQIFKLADSNLPADDLASLGAFKVTDLNRFKSYMTDQYIARLADKNLAAKVYIGDSPEPQTLTGMQYEVPAIHEQTLKRMELHIIASDMLIPVSRGLPGAHAEVQAGSAALYIQQHLTGSTNPADISIVTQRLQQAEQALAFEACFNCTGQLVATYENTVVSFNVLSGASNQDHEFWSNHRKNLNW